MQGSQTVAALLGVSVLTLKSVLETESAFLSSSICQKAQFMIIIKSEVDYHKLFGEWIDKVRYHICNEVWKPQLC